MQIGRLESCNNISVRNNLDRIRLQGRKSVTVNAAERQLWYPGGEAPKHLDGSLAGDYGCASACRRLPLVP